MNQYKVFVVDDDEDDWEFIKEAFEQVGCAYHIEHFLSSAILLEHFKCYMDNQFPDLVVLDHQTSDKNGSEAVLEIRNNDKYSSIVLVVYSSSIQPSMQEKLSAQGVDLCLAKGNSQKEMISHIQKFCEIVDKKRSLEAEQG